MEEVVEIIVAGITLENYMKYPLQDILDLPDSSCKKELLEAIKEQLRLIPSKFIDLHKTIYEIQGAAWEDAMYEENNTSQIFCPGHVVTLHGGIKVSRSSKERICHFCSLKIPKGEEIITYRPLLWDHNDHQAHVLKSIILRKDCEHYLPDSIQDLEQMVYYTEHSSEIYDEDEVFPNNISYGNRISYGEVSANGGIGSQRLNRNSQRPKIRLMLAKIRNNGYN